MEVRRQEMERFTAREVDYVDPSVVDGCYVKFSDSER